MSEVTAGRDGLSTMAMSVLEFSKALESLEEAILLYKKAQNSTPEQKAFRDACIQRFEYTLELSWKLSMKVLGSKTTAAKIAVREMAQNKLIENPELWMSFIEARNNSSHSYDENVAKKVYESSVLFVFEAKKLMLLLEKM